MQHLRLEALICNISVGEKVTHVTDSYDVPHFPTHHPTRTTLILMHLLLLRYF